MNNHEHEKGSGGDFVAEVFLYLSIYYHPACSGRGFSGPRAIGRAVPRALSDDLDSVKAQF